MVVQDADWLERRARELGEQAARLERRYLATPLAPAIVSRLGVEAFRRELAPLVSTVSSAHELDTLETGFVATFRQAYAAGWRGKR